MKTTNTNSFEDVIKATSSKKNILLDFSKTWIAYLILVVFIIASFVIKGIVQDRVNADLDTEFEKSYSSVLSRLDNQYQRLYQVISSTQGTYYQKVQVVRDIFELNGAVPVQNFKSIICLNYAPKVLAKGYPEYEYYALSEGYNAYDLHPKEKRDYYYPVEHIVKYESNPGRLAFDYASLPIMKDAIELAQAQNMIVSTEFFDLRPDTLSFALIAPVYKQGTNFTSNEDLQQNFIGSVVMEINADTYFSNALRGNDESGVNSSFPSDSSIIFEIIDRTSENKDVVVYKSNNFDLQKSNYAPLIIKNIPISIANRDLHIRISTVPGFGGAMQQNLPTIVFAAALLLSVLAFMLVVILLTQKARAEEVAERMTASQRRIMDTSRDIISVVSNDGTWLSMNPASLTLLGLEPNKIIGTKVAHYLFDDKDIKNWNNVLETKEENQRIDLRVKSNNEMGFTWISFSFTKPSNENLIYAIGRDVTLEKAAAEELKVRSKQIDLANTFEQEASISKVHLMIQLSHEMRNQLTSMMGYLQLITAGAYENDDELQAFAGSAYESAESAFTYIHDISEATIGDTSTLTKVVVHKIEDTVSPVIAQYKSEKKSLLNIQYAENGKDAHIIVDDTILGEVWSKLFRILTADNPKNIIKLTANENKLESVTEIIVEADSNTELARLIDVYNIAPQNVAEHLREDSSDILLDLAKVASYISRMMGIFNIESMDDGKTAYIFITLPLALRNRDN